jgi:TolB protein
VLDSYPYATTSPIYVTVGGQPIRSLADADYFVAWIGRLEAVAWAYKDWNTEAERSNTLESLQRAKAIFQARRSR